MCASWRWSKPVGVWVLAAVDSSAFVRQNSGLQARRAGHWCWENCLLWGKDPSTHGSNPVFVKSTEERWILEHMKGCWSWRWKLKERYKHKVKANVRQSRKAAAKHWTMKTVGADSAWMLAPQYSDNSALCICICAFVCVCARMQRHDRLHAEMTIFKCLFIHSSRQWQIFYPSYQYLTEIIFHLCWAWLSRAIHSTNKMRKKSTIINEWHNPSFVFLS